VLQHPNALTSRKSRLLPFSVVTLTVYLISYVNGACYLKHTITTSMDAAQVWTATLVGAQPASQGLSCDNKKDDGKTYTVKDGRSYIIECGVDHFGGDLTAVDSATFESCMDVCDSTTGCLDVSWVSGSCYMKNTLTTASQSQNVWTGRLVTPSTPSASSTPVPTETPLDLTATQFTNNNPAGIRTTAEKNLFSLVISGPNPPVGLSTRLNFPTIPNNIYEITFDFYQDPSSANDAHHFIEIGDGWGYLATLYWTQAAGQNILSTPYYSQALSDGTGSKIDACENSRFQPKKSPVAGTWNTGTMILKSRASSGYFRRDFSGSNSVQWKNVYVRQMPSNYCG
jgi:hypothetical protein